MTDTPRGYRRDVRGRFARPVPDVDAESKFGPMGADIPFDDVSGAPSSGTIEHPRYAPQADNLAQGGQSSPLRARRPEMVHPDDADHTIYGKQGAMLRTAARSSGPLDPSAYLTGLAPRTAPPEGVRQVSDENDVAEIRQRIDQGLFSGDASRAVRPASMGQGRARNR